MFSDYQKSAIRYWEKRRLILNAILLTDAWISWSISNAFTVGIDDISGAKISDPGVLWQFVKIFAVLNIIFSMGYVAEFFIHAPTPKKYWPTPFRTVFMVLLCVTCLWGLGSRSGTIAMEAAYTKAGVFGYGEKKEIDQPSEPTSPSGFRVSP